MAGSDEDFELFGSLEGVGDLIGTPRLRVAHATQDEHYKAGSRMSHIFLITVPLTIASGTEI